MPERRPTYQLPMVTTNTWQPTTSTNSAICPDLLNIRDIGEADGWRGHVVRIFFRVLRKVTGL